MSRWHCFLAVLAVLLMCADDSWTYTLILRSESAAPRRWPAGSLPVVMELNDQTGPDLPNVTGDSDPVAAIQRALTKFPAVSGVQFQSGATSATSGGQDGANIITFADTPSNRSAFEMAGGNSVVGLTLSFSVNSDLVEADLLFNPSLQFTTTLDTDAELRDAGLFDIEAVATHELGHVIGLHHTGVESAAMWPLASVLQRRLDADDIAGARTLYPVDGGGGTIAGTVTVAGAPAFGAHVVAVTAAGAIAASALSLPDGQYAIEQLAPGSYTVYVEPLDGPHASVPDDPCVRVGNLSGAGIYDGATLTTDFPTSFISGAVVVTAGGTASADFSLPSGAPPVNPVRIGPAVVDGGSVSASVATRPLSVSPGAEQWVAISGPNMDQVPIEGIDIGPDILVDQSSREELSSSCNDAPSPFLLFRIEVATSAAPGGRAIILTAGGNSVTLTGGLRIAETLSPCIGDCDENHVVDIEELIQGIEITLGTRSLAQCMAFDVSGDERVTVDELTQAVHSAVDGCR